MNREPLQLFDCENFADLPQLAALAKQSWKRVSYKAPSLLPARNWSSEEKLSYLRQQKVGRFALIDGPDLWASLGPKFARGPSKRAMLHLDYTASAQGLQFIERYLQECLSTYANTHTENSTTGRVSTQRFHEAIEFVRQHVNAGVESFVIPTGFGATGAIEKIQKILGLYLSPKGQKTILESLGIDLRAAMAKKVVVFVGPYEHHSNDVSWQDDALCTFVRIKALRGGPQRNEIDFADLEMQLLKYDGYLKIGSFSAASNVTGLKCDLKVLGDLLHAHGALFFVDYAACGPYADISMERDGIDAIFLSVHKNLGGSNIGFLIGRQHIYDKSSNPSFGGGGTVTAVTPWEYHFHDSIEGRESAGTPAIRQTWQAALSFQVKEWVGQDLIERRDTELCKSMIDFFAQHPKLDLLGNPDPHKRHPIFSFLVKHGDRYLHHTLVAVLFNDFFGIQARSGCACAGPFGHELLEISQELSHQYVELILNILNGFKPGWLRIGAHYTMSNFELHYTQRAISAIAWFGPLFLDQYKFDPYTGDWLHMHSPAIPSKLDLEDALRLPEGASLLPQLPDEATLEACYLNQLEEFYYLAATQISKLIIQEAGASLETKVTLDMLAAASYPFIKQHAEASPQRHESEFLLQLSRRLCPLLAKPGKNPEECRSEIEKLLGAIIFAPEHQRHRFEPFAEIEADVPFFYVGKGQLTRPLVLQGAEASEECRACPVV